MYNKMKYYSLIQNLCIILFSSVPSNKYKIAFAADVLLSFLNPFPCILLLGSNFYSTNVTILADITNAILYLFKGTEENTMMERFWMREKYFILSYILQYSFYIFLSRWYLDNTMRLMDSCSKYCVYNWSWCVLNFATGETRSDS